MEGPILIFRTPSIFYILEQYIQWRDLIHIMCTCRSLYFDWVSHDTQKWKDLKLPGFICTAVLAIPFPLKLNPIKTVRERARRSIILGTLSYALLPCMGGCGDTVQKSRVVSPALGYAVCKRCALVELGFGRYVVKIYFKKHGLTDRPETYAMNYARNTIECEKTWLRVQLAIHDYWVSFCFKQLVRITEWSIPVYRQHDIRVLIDRLLRQHLSIKI